MYALRWSGTERLTDLGAAVSILPAARTAICAVWETRYKETAATRAEYSLPGGDLHIDIADVAPVTQAEVIQSGT